MNIGKSHPHDASGKAIQRKAAEWLARHQAGGLTLNEEADFADWCAQNPRHAAIYSEVKVSWQAFDRLADYPHSADTAPDPDLLAPRRRVSRFVAPSLLAAAAAIAIMGAYQLNLWNTFSPEIAPVEVAQFEPRLVHLPDGSEVELNADCEISVYYTTEARRVRLVRGEAHFIVAKNMELPFIVEANGVAVRAVGTAFNVRLLPDTTAVEVLVSEGTVQVALPPVSTTSGPSPAALQRSGFAMTLPLEESAILTAGQRTVVSTLAGAERSKFEVETLAAPEIERALSWQSRRLILDATPLTEVVERLNRHAAGLDGLPRLTVADPQLGELKISGRIRSENIESFVEALETNFDVIAERRPDGEIVLRRR